MKGFCEATKFPRISSFCLVLMRPFARDFECNFIGKSHGEGTMPEHVHRVTLRRLPSVASLAEMGGNNHLDSIIS